MNHLRKQLDELEKAVGQEHQAKINHEATKLITATIQFILRNHYAFNSSAK